MRYVTKLVILLILGACSQQPMFPPHVMKGVETGSVGVAAWKDNPSAGLQRVEVGGRILKAEEQPDAVTILAEELPIVSHPSYGPSAAAQHGAPFVFAVSSHQALDTSWLQPGNRFIVIGQTQGINLVTIDETSTSKPQIVAQCLHIWKTEGGEIANFPYETGAGYYPLEERTFCLEK